MCMSTFLGLGKKYVEWFYNKTGNAVFLHIRRIRKEVSFNLSIHIYLSIQKKVNELMNVLGGGD